MIALRSGDAVLFVLLRAMGDVLLATPLLRAFKKAYPDVAVDVLAERTPLQPLRHNPHIRSLIVAPNRGAPPGAYFPLLRRLQGERYRLTVDALSTPGSALLTRLTGAPTRVGFRLRGRGWAYTHPVEPNAATIYGPLAKFPLLSAVGLTAPDAASADALLPELFIADEEVAAAERLLEERELTEGPPLIGLAPYCRRVERMWDMPNWARLMQIVAAQTKSAWLLLAAPGERGLLRNLERLAGVRVVWAGAPDLRVAAALMGRCRVVVGGENGLLHLAVAARVPTYTIFSGRDDPRRWTPPGKARHQWVDLRGRREDPEAVEMVVAELMKIIGV